MERRINWIERQIKRLLALETPRRVYGAMYADDVTQLVVVASTGVYYPVTASLSTGLTHGVTFQSASQLLISYPGTYLINWAMSLSAGNNDHIEGAIMINSTVSGAGETAAHTPGPGDQVAVSGTAILALAAGDIVRFCVENESDADDITMSHASMTVVLVGPA